MGFGKYGHWPFRFGGGKRPRELVRDTLLDAYRPVLDVSDEQLAESEAYAEAACLAMIWVAGKRAANQGQPLRMLDWLASYEQAMQMHPGPGDSDFQRRAELAAKFVALTGNAERDILAAVSSVMGINIVSVVYLDDTECTTYLPSINPGPPQLEWFSQRCIAFVEVTGSGLTGQQYTARVSKLEETLEGILPAWMGYQVARFDEFGSGSGFYLDISLLDEVGL